MKNTTKKTAKMNCGGSPKKMQMGGVAGGKDKDNCWDGGKAKGCAKSTNEPSKTKVTIVTAKKKEKEPKAPAKAAYRNVRYL